VGHNSAIVLSQNTAYFLGAFTGTLLSIVSGGLLSIYEARNFFGGFYFFGHGVILFLLIGGGLRRLRV
tara:strand:+ start:1832 stop:2035 length:204 start_codon:yes stop_codon:yes gene_type:complete